MLMSVPTGTDVTGSDLRSVQHDTEPSAEREPMRAAVLEAVGTAVEVGDVDLRGPGRGEVLVRVAACGVCHSDLSVIDGSFPSPLPVVLGHEAAGVVEAVGEDVTRVAPGDHVVLTPLPPCGSCY